MVLFETIFMSLVHLQTRCRPRPMWVYRSHAPPVQPISAYLGVACQFLPIPGFCGLTDWSAKRSSKSLAFVRVSSIFSLSWRSANPLKVRRVRERSTWTEQSCLFSGYSKNWQLHAKFLLPGRLILLIMSDTWRTCFREFVWINGRRV